MAATLSWQVPGVTSDNTFSVVLVSDQALQNVSLDDFTFRRDDGMFFEASTYAVLTQVAGTNNWRLDVTLTGTHDNNFQVRLRPNRVTDEDGAMNALLNSASFAVDTSHVGFTVVISGGDNIEQGQQVTLTATVTDADGNTPPGTIQYAWRASRGSFVGATNGMTVDYLPNFTGAFDVTCEVTRAADATPTSSGPSLTALADIGVTGILLNMFMTELGAVAANTNNALYNATTGTLASGSDQALSTDINIFQLRWDSRNNNFVMNNDGTGHLANFFTNNNNQSVYIVFDDGTYEELTLTDFNAGTSRGQTWSRWLVSDSDIVALFDGLATTDDLVVGVGDAGSIGLDVETGSVTASLTARVVQPPQPLGIESINEQFITIGTEDYDLVINITGRPDSAKAIGHMEGFGQDWDSVNGQLHIKSEEVTRLISGVNWDIEVVKDMQTLMGQVAYNVVAAAPIFASLETIHLYKGVPINFDIIIQNIPPLLIPNAELLGLKSELLEYGINVKGEISVTDNFAFSSGNVTIIVPSDSGGADTRYDYAYEIEDGSPPQIMSPTLIPKGGYGILEFPDVTHALGYAWKFGTDDVWNVFDSTRAVIDPGQVEITHGHLNVTVKFPNVAGASRYAYMLESETYTVDWTAFTGTLDTNGFIRTVIPLQEGVTVDLSIRVDQPWQGAPITLQVTGGRVCYTLEVDFTTARDSHYLYLYHTGYAHGSRASRIKRLLLPTSLTHPEGGGLAVNSDGDVFIGNLTGAIGSEKAIYTFLASTIENATDGSRLTQDRKNPFPSTLHHSHVLKGMAAYNGNLYTYTDRPAPADWSRLRVMPVPQSDGAELTTIGGSSTASSSTGGMSVTDESIWLTDLFSGRIRPTPFDRTLFTGGSDVDLFWENGTTFDSVEDGLKVIGDDFYTVVDANENRLEVFRINPEVHATRHVLDFWLVLPSGLDRPRFLDILV